MRILAIFTCFNRKELTRRSMELLAQNKTVTFDYVILDDNRLRNIVEIFDFEDDKPVSPVVAENHDMEESGYESEEEAVGREEQPDGDDAIQEAENTMAEANDDAPEKLVAEGVSFMEKMIEVLSNENTARRLVDSMVFTDNKTGRTTVNIPVKDKETVMKFVSVVGSLIRNFGKL